jgi:REP element-mobilizing transposase RayT
MCGVWYPKSPLRLLAGWVAGSLDANASENGIPYVGRAVMPDQLHVFVRVRPAQVAGLFMGRTSQMMQAECWWLRRPQVLGSKPYLAGLIGYVSEQIVRRHIEHQRRLTA